MSDNLNPLHCRDSIGCVFFALIIFILVAGALL